MSDASPTTQLAQLSPNDRGALEAAAALTSAVNSAMSATSTAALDTAQICKTYQGLRPTLERFLPYIGFIPVIGSAAATAIRGLMALLDALCGTS